jgi:peptidoglycan/LPS O-acetylase OafA/YrhL
MPSTTPAKAHRPRLLVLDSARIFAALAVMAYHFTATRWRAWDGPPTGHLQGLSDVAAYGALGVQLFFVISGFVILMSAYGRTVGHFAASRVARLFPAYWVGVALTSVLLILLTQGRLKKVTWGEALVNLTMLQEALGVRHVDGVYWTLWIELVFYFTIAVFLWRGMTYHRILAFIVLWPLIGLLAARANSEMLNLILVPRYSALFAAGMALYLIYAHGHDFVRWALVGLNAVIAGQQTVAHHLPSMRRNTGVELSSGVTWLLILSFVAVVALATLTPLRSMGWRWMAVAGALTYPVYLVHEYWGLWIVSELRPAIGPWLALFVGAVACLSMAWLIHRFVERPFGPRLRAVVAGNLHQLDHPSRQARARAEQSASTITVGRRSSLELNEPART